VKKLAQYGVEKVIVNMNGAKLLSGRKEGVMDKVHGIDLDETKKQSGILKNLVSVLSAVLGVVS